MVHTGIFATSSEITTKAGAYNSTTITEAVINALCLQVESDINVRTRYNWSDAYAGLDADVKGILSEAESNLVALYMIMYDMSGYTSLGEAQLMLNVLRDGYERCIKELEDIKVRDFVINA